MIASFESFWAELTSDEIWFDGIKVKYTNKDLRSIAQDCYLDLLAQPNRWKAQDFSDFRRCYQKWVMNAKPMVSAPQLQQFAEPVKVLSEDERKRMEPIPKNDPRYDAYLKLWQEQVDKFAVDHVVPRVSKKEAMEQGDWLPAKPAPYKGNDDVFMIHLKENIRRYAAKKYKGVYSWTGFRNYDIGLVQVYAQNLDDAKEFVTKAERYTRMKLRLT